MDVVLVEHRRQASETGMDERFFLESSCRSAARKSRKARLGFETTAWWSRSDSNQPPKCYGTWLVSDQLPWSNTHPDTGSFAVLRDYPGVLRRAVHVGPTGPFLKAGFLEIPLLWKRPSIADFLSASTGVRRGGLVGHPPCSITLWWLVRVRPAPPRSCPRPENSGTA